MWRTLFPLLLLWQTYAELLMVIEVARHGARSPTIPDSEFALGTHWDIGALELTKSGERQHFLLGLKRRRQYIDNEQFLSDVYKHGEVYAESTDTNRTLMSAYAHLLGLYPPQKRETISFTANGVEHSISTPVPVHSRALYTGFLDENNNGKPWKTLLQKSREESNLEFASYQFVKDMIDEINAKVQPKEKVGTFQDLSDSVDMIVANEFEMLPINITFSEKFYHNINNFFVFKRFHADNKYDLVTRI